MRNSTPLSKAPLKATIFDYFLNFLPYFANQFSPLFTFIAVIFFTSKLAQDSEIIAMLSTGNEFSVGSEAVTHWCDGYY